MLPDWFTKPESLFRTALWLLGPFLTFFIGRVILRRYESWEAARSEASARINLDFLLYALDNPPTLLASVAYIICFLPLPIAIGMVLSAGYLVHFRNPFTAIFPRISPEVAGTILSSVFFVNYILFALLTVHGIRVAYRL